MGVQKERPSEEFCLIPFRHDFFHHCMIYQKMKKLRATLSFLLFVFLFFSLFAFLVDVSAHLEIAITEQLGRGRALDVRTNLYFHRRYFVLLVLHLYNVSGIVE